MSDTQFKASSETIRQKTLALLADLMNKARSFDMPEWPTVLAASQQKLAANVYNVLVVGEAKRGKSSFVNALIGRDLLPTDVAIVTNQVFHVSRSEHEEYRLRFEDGSAQTITEGDLRTYGSQSAAEKQGADLQQLRWIEVDIPVRFLPPGVSILDTPGLGSLFAAHAQITQRFIPQADAVIFVLDSDRPMGQDDVAFLEKIVEVTSHVFFIQTKIDRYDSEAWQQILQRNHEILRERFDGRLDDMRIWPISSRNLMRAAQTNNPAFLKISRQQELLEALEAFHFKVSGWNRCADTLLIASHYHTLARKTLAGRLELLEASPGSNLAELRKSLAQRLQQFDSDWGAQGKKRRELQSDVQRIADAGRRTMLDFLDAGSNLEIDMRHKIDTLPSLKEANAFGAALSEQVVTAAISKWRELCAQANDQCSKVLGSLIESTDSLSLLPENPRLVTRMGEDASVQDTVWSKIGQAQSGFLLGANAGIAAVLIASSFIPITVPIALVGIAIAGILGAGQQVRYRENQQLKEAQKKLHDHLSDVLQQIRKRFEDSDLRYEGKSLIDYYFSALVEAMGERIDAIIASKQADLQKEQTRLEEQSKLDAQQRVAQREICQQQLSAWDALGAAMAALAEEMQAAQPLAVSV